MSARIAASIAGALSLFATWLWLMTPGPPVLGQASEAPGLVPGVYYAIDSTGPTITFDLPTGIRDSCELVLSSLGSSEESYVVRLDATAMTERRSVCPVAIAPLEWKRPVPRARDAARKSCPLPLETSCAGGAAGRESCISDLARRQFDLHVTDSELENPRAYTRVIGRCLKEGKEVRIYGDEQLSETQMPTGLLDEIVHLFDEQILPRSRELLGVHCDVDGDGKLAILITPWLGRLQGGRTSVNGFVRSADFRKGGKPPFSNRADLIYLNSGLRTDDGLAAILAHEYTHTVCISARMQASERFGPLPDEEDWLSEAISHVAERRHGAGWSNLDERVARFLAEPERSPLVVRDYYRAGLWRDQGCRGATFLFLNWLAGECGDGLLRELVSDPRTGEQKLTALTGHSLAELLRHWAIALHRGRLAGLDLNGTIGRQDLKGLRRRDWTNPEESHAVALKGTSVACIRLSTTTSRRIVITPSPGTRLQVTLNFPESNESRPAAQLADAGHAGKH